MQMDRLNEQSYFYTEFLSPETVSEIEGWYGNMATVVDTDIYPDSESGFTTGEDRRKYRIEVYNFDCMCIVPLDNNMFRSRKAAMAWLKRAEYEYVPYDRMVIKLLEIKKLMNEGKGMGKPSGVRKGEST